MSEAKVEMSEEMFEFLADVLAEAERFTEADCPIRLRHRSGGGRPFPCVDTNEERLRTQNEERDRQMERQREPVNIHPIQNGRYSVAIPRDDSWRPQRAVQLLEACMRIHR